MANGLPSFVTAQPFSSTPVVGDNFGDGGGGDEPTKTTAQTTPLAEAKVKEMYAQTEYDEAKKKQSEGKAAAEKARQAAIYEEYKPQLTQKFEPFQAPKDTFQGLASIGMMMMAVGSMGGKKGLTSATGAMNAIAGMATGYQQGRKEEFDRQKAIFDENFRIMKENQAQIEKEFQYALKYAKTDLTGATTKLASNLQARGMTAAAQGLTGGTETITSAHDKVVGPMKKTISQMDEYKEKLLGAKADVIRAEEYAKTQKSELTKADFDAARFRMQTGDKPHNEKEAAAMYQLNQEAIARGGITYTPSKPEIKGSDLLWVEENGKKTRMTPKEITDAKNEGRKIEYTSAPKESAGGMNARFSDNVLRSGNEALRSYEIWDKMGANVGQGVFGAVTNKGTISSALTSSLANRMSSDEMRNYNTIASDLSYEIATAMSGGYRVNQTTIDKIERAIKAVDGDSYQNVAFKFATGIAKLRSAIEPTTTYSDEQKKTKEQILKRSEKYVTPEDVLDKVGKKQVLRSDLLNEAKRRNISPKEAERLAMKQGYIIYDPFPSPTEIKQNIIKDKSDE